MIVDNKMTLSEFQARALLSSGQGPKIFKRNRVFRPETVVYFDQNVFSDLNDDEIAFCKKNRKTKFAYSPAHAEEIFRMQQSEKKRSNHKNNISSHQWIIYTTEKNKGANEIFQRRTKLRYR
ncbi:hypothetical protein [Acetobacter okinawensis]|uniref:hypothetical protein n=1 Tax=Acetobacter okinawensis TaxID=1076594 RepID=UPI0011DE53AE|nr:hypothetical protein [Acetobacter okinawensis]